jgi:hypothetical protein
MTGTTLAVSRLRRAVPSSIPGDTVRVQMVHIQMTRSPDKSMPSPETARDNRP